MGLIVFDMGRRIETPVTPPRLRTRPLTPATAPAKITHDQPDTALDAYTRHEERSSGHLPQSVAFARDIMSAPVLTIDEEAAADSAYSLMSDHGVHHLAVVNRSGQLTGIVSDRDLLKSFAGRRESNGVVMGIASRPVYCVQERTDIRQTAKLLCDYHIGALPVISDTGNLTGIITRTDLLQLISHYGPLELWA